MSNALSFAEVDSQRLELLPARIVLTTLGPINSAGSGDDGGTGGHGGFGNAGGQGTGGQGGDGHGTVVGNNHGFISPQINIALGFGGTGGEGQGGGIVANGGEGGRGGEDFNLSNTK